MIFIWKQERKHYLKLKHLEISNWLVWLPFTFLEYTVTGTNIKIGTWNLLYMTVLKLWKIEIKIIIGTTSTFTNLLDEGLSYNMQKPSKYTFYYWMSRLWGILICHSWLYNLLFRYLKRKVTETNKPNIFPRIVSNRLLVETLYLSSRGGVKEEEEEEEMMHSSGR